ncbi:MAG: hypothetical protein ACK56I_35290 [bacterium]
MTYVHVQAHDSQSGTDEAEQEAGHRHPGRRLQEAILRPLRRGRCGRQ